MYKSGPRNVLENYRSISILPVVAKVLEKEVVHKQLYQHLAENNLLYPCQKGFRPKRSTHSALIKVSDHSLSNMDKGLVSVVIFLDLAKAFHTEKHSLLINKLKALGVNGINLDWFQWFASYLDCRQQQVFYNGELSATQSITTGVPQGSVLVPLLFLVYVNELPNNIRENSRSMFADDTVYSVYTEYSIQWNQYKRNRRKV